MEWIDIWENEPPRNEEILFMTGDEQVHYGEIFDTVKLRKCRFRSYTCKEYYECDLLTPLHDRVIYWHPIPTIPIKKE